MTFMSVSVQHVGYYSIRFMSYLFGIDTIINHVFLSAGLIGRIQPVIIIAEWESEYDICHRWVGG